MKDTPLIGAFLGSDSRKAGALISSWIVGGWLVWSGLYDAEQFMDFVRWGLTAYLGAQGAVDLSERLSKEKKPDA